jgi:hypothetical protein
MQLYALRAQIDAVILGLEEEVGIRGPQHGACPKCGAPEEQQKDASTLDGTRKKRCLVCREEYPG